MYHTRALSIIPFLVLAAACQDGTTAPSTSPTSARPTTASAAKGGNGPGGGGTPSIAGHFILASTRDDAANQDI
jgi:hypothetical protein